MRHEAYWLLLSPYSTHCSDGFLKAYVFLHNLFYKLASVSSCKASLHLIQLLAPVVPYAT